MNKRNYIRQVLSHIECSYAYRKRIKEDLLLTIENRLEGSDQDIVSVLGRPENYAMEIIDDQNLRPARGFEYISERTFLGLPLIHINTKRMGTAKGIIAIGLKSMGFVSLGIFSLGFISFGVVALGLVFAFGSIALSLLTSFGALAASLYLSFGAISVSNVAIGALSFGNSLALGDIAYGDLALYKTRGVGDITLQIHEEFNQIRPLLEERLSSSSLIDIIMAFVRSM